MESLLYPLLAFSFFHDAGIAAVTDAINSARGLWDYLDELGDT